MPRGTISRSCTYYQSTALWLSVSNVDISTNIDMQPSYFVAALFLGTTVTRTVGQFEYGVGGVS